MGPSRSHLTTPFLKDTRESKTNKNTASYANITAKSAAEIIFKVKNQIDETVIIRSSEKDGRKAAKIIDKSIINIKEKIKP